MANDGVKLTQPDMEQALEDAYILATSDKTLPKQWVTRMERLGDSPSVGFIAAVGSVLLAKATNPAIDAFVIQKKEGSPGAFSLRRPATALAAKRRAFGYDIASTSDRDPINHGTLIGSPRWDVALDRILPAHKPFFQVILTWLPDINNMSQAEALEALAAFMRVRRGVSSAGVVAQVPLKLSNAPSVTELIGALEGVVSANAERGASGMALVAAAFRAAGFDAGVPSRNDPRHIDIPIRAGGQLVIACEVKQLATNETTADSLSKDVVEAGARIGLLAVLRPGHLENFDRTSVIRRAETTDGVVLRVTDGVRELLHEAIASSTVPIEDFCASLPRHFAETLEEIHAQKATIETWAALAQQWTS